MPARQHPVSAEAGRERGHLSTGARREPGLDGWLGGGGGGGGGSGWS